MRTNYAKNRSERRKASCDPKANQPAQWSSLTENQRETMPFFELLFTPQFQQFH